MNVTLGSEFEKRINEKVASGLYTSASEVIRDGLRLLFEKDISKQQQLEILRQEVGKGFQQLSEGRTSGKSALDIFAEVSNEIDGKL
ncbi:type II toxin-antitoxin system ParD family antitoxin [Alteromonas sp. 1_MG-2023]|uniref:type II toxin-antitoxin system ParD family antitoxin n=1 Tax=Alteromonas sp. 1_MG-2023 TaxID=3062669 RepID=UPI0026E42F38|nr:type II toxin-antitoxin system ParD family antitoxin [Alteromonas sp. 1_MG-2023]MDO6475299.1 type II toxin-antitoxin system ParD family antitoxin [Alteromonas sp. 1_MG-2023]